MEQSSDLYQIYINPHYLPSSCSFLCIYLKDETRYSVVEERKKAGLLYNDMTLLNLNCAAKLKERY
jgi:hypothetical protein